MVSWPFASFSAIFSASSSLTSSRAFSTKFGSVESLNVSDRCGWRLNARQIVFTVERETPLAAALRTDVFYIGALGSKKTQGARVERLKAAGFGDDAIARIHGPIGLAIGAKGAPEIAVSIMAEMTRTLRLGD